jgi:ABC-type proline/glycine betaine transport system permease subunit
VAKDASLFDELEIEITAKPKPTINGGIIGVVLMALAGIIIRGMLVQWGWNYFVVHGLNAPPINAALVLGISSLAFFFTNDPSTVMSMAQRQAAKRNFGYYLIAFLAWFVIWQFV